ncbi:MAG TPA: hypothetical protein VFM73_05875 [Xanthomonadaceae bacterium]|nr:hypothetical protein [Xanthomonadaceae bacterium]
MNRVPPFIVASILAALGIVACRPAPGDRLPPAEANALPGFTTGASGAAVASTGSNAPILRDVRIARHEGFDRIVFEFDSDGLPQWHVDYVDAPLIQCGSGHPTPVEGSAWLQVRFNGANAHTEAGEGTSGPGRRTVDLPSVREVVRTCDFEAEVTWIAGLAGRQAYRPRVLADPARLVVDVAH